ncbi:MFS transporter [Isoptericola sp. b441]|uniref:MFS transporter n=1 Tax=Actinotalea lenta TaxID=3064654 RepID=A0ABT9D8U8_9CELL|nr:MULTISPECIES: MFS transporter [unclassified Isoptericola]MDO8105598.1 MFS transporter [Isoptericola sp. b441]MDO8122718.1 MFS transporter [Isoptericola sp. b490]
MSAEQPEVAAPVPLPAPPGRSLVHHADFRRLWLGDGLGQLGAQLGNLAIPVFAVATLDATAWQMGALTAAESAAFLAIGLPAGAWVDRMRKRSTLISADLVRAAVLAVVVVVALTGHASMPVLYAAALAMSAATVFFDVAYQSYLPGLVGPTHLVQGNSLLQATQSVAQIAGPALGGLLLRVLSAPMLLVGTVVTYLSSAASVSRIRMVEQLPDPSSRRPLRHEIAEGLTFVLRHPLLRRVVACTGISNLSSSIAGALLVLYVLRELGLTEAQLGVVLSASAAGGLLGAVASSRLARWFGEGRVIPLAALMTPVAWALVPLADPLARTGVPALGVLAAGGVAFYAFVVVYNVAQVSFRQRVCPPALLGRMNASVRFLVWGPMPIGGLLGGVLGEHLGVVPTLWVAVAGLALAAVPVVASPLWRMRTLPGPGETTPAQTV